MDESLASSVEFTAEIFENKALSQVVGESVFTIEFRKTCGDIFEFKKLIAEVSELLQQ